MFNSLANNRKIGIERIGDEIFLRNVVKFKYLEDLKTWGWWDLLSMERDVFPCAIRLFYFFGDDHEYNDNGKRLETKYKDQFTIMVFGEEVVVNGELIIDLLGIKHTSGPSKVPNDFNNTIKVVEACRVAYNNEGLDSFVNKVGDFNIHARILHLMISHTLNARQGIHAIVNKEYVFWMSQIMMGNPPNLG